MFNTNEEAIAYMRRLVAACDWTVREAACAAVRQFGGNLNTLEREFNANTAPAVE